MMRSHPRLIAVAVLVSILAGTGCKKSSSNPECDPIDYTNAPPHGYNIVTVGKRLRSACFNPNNEDELVFWSVDEGAADALYIYNYKTSQNRKLLELNLWYPPKWGSNGWILLGVAGGHIGKVKSNGDSLTNITQSSGSFHHPNWNTSSTCILVYSLDNPHKLLSLNGVIKDTFLIGGSENNFIDDDRIIVGGAGATIYTLSKREHDHLATAIPQATGSGGQMVTDEEFIWADESGIYRTNIVTRQTTTLKTTCDAVMYLSPSVNKSRTKALWMRLAQQVKGDDLRQDYEIVQMNTDGTGEREIPIPE